MMQELRHNYFLKHKNIKHLAKKGLEFNSSVNGYYGTVRDFDILVQYKLASKGQIWNTYEMNIVFNKTSVENTLKKEVKRSFADTEITDTAITKSFEFLLVPPSRFELLETMNELIDFLEENHIQPVKTDILSHKLKFNSVA